ncbi:MAG: hypothetical protein IT214_11860 [Chitinophagaceae bacterium]|jgi:hypothetical protein|nr:hypothetical protein [Chitinophagaceae bacterium]
MKKLENLGRRLSKEEQKNILGGLANSGGCFTARWTGCNDCGGPNETCDYHVVYPSGYETDWCEQGCFSDCRSEGCVHTQC